jgi:Domain of unknown function (DUF5664)
MNDVAEHATRAIEVMLRTPIRETVKEPVREPVKEHEKKETIVNEPPKIDHTLLPLDALEEVSRALMHGEEKYDAQRWVTHPHRYRDLLAKVYRHLTAFQKGETIDPSSGLQHLSSAICDLMFLQANVLRGTGTDDRLPYPKVK